MSVAPTLAAGRSTTSRALPLTRIGCMRRSPAAGSGSRSSAPTTGARRGSAGSAPRTSRWTDGGQTWEPVGNTFVYDGVPGTHQWYDGTPHPWEFKRVWHLEP